MNLPSFSKLVSVLQNNFQHYGIAGGLILAEEKIRGRLHADRARELHDVHDAHSSPSVDLLGKPFRLHSSMRGLSESVYMYGVHEPELSKHYEAAIKPGDVVLDIGGNIGYFPILAANKTEGTGRAIALEPSPETFPLLTENTASWNVSVHNLCVAEKRGTVLFHISDVPNLSGLIRYKDSR